MKPKTLAILGICTVAAVAVAGYTLSRQGRVNGDSAETGRALFPGLNVNDAAQITIAKGKDTFSATAKGDGTWGLSDRGGYPVKFETVKAALVGIAGLTIHEEGTSKEENYAKIGVADPTKVEASDTSTSMLLTIADAQGKTLASVILGNNRASTGFNAPQEIYVRRAGESQSWLVRPLKGGERLDIRATAMDWVDRQVLTIARDRIRAVTVTHSDGERIDIYKDRKEDTNFKLSDMPEGRELKYPSSPDAVAGALSYLSMDDVKPADQIDFNSLPPEPGNDIATAEYRTWDGVVIVARSAKIGDRTWVKFESRYEEPPPPPAPPETPAAPSPVDPGSGDPPPSGPSAQEPAPAQPPEGNAQPEAKPDEAETAHKAAQTEAAQLHAKLSPWAFAVADYQANNLMMRREGLLKELPGQPSTLTPPEGIESLLPGAQPGGMGPEVPPPPPPPGGEPSPEPPPPAP